MTNKISAALELRKALQYFLETLDPDTQAEKVLRVPSVYPEYRVGKTYKARDVFRKGKNAVGDPQLYQVLQDHTSAEQWPPESSHSMYKAIGVNKDGIPAWVQPLGASDSYEKGCVVNHNGKIWVSDEAANVWEPGVYGWTEKTEQAGG